jgi:hypothetical protein
MFDFEFRLWQQSLSDAGQTPTGEELAENAESSDYTIQDKKGNVIRPKTKEEIKDSLAKRKIAVERRKREEAKKLERDRHRPRRCPNMPPKEQAPTGDGLEKEQKNPLPQPLSEMQVVTLRRAVIDAYREELERNRGFTG